MQRSFDKSFERKCILSPFPVLCSDIPLLVSFHFLFGPISSHRRYILPRSSTSDLIYTPALITIDFSFSIPAHLPSTVPLTSLAQSISFSKPTWFRAPLAPRTLVDFTPVHQLNSLVPFYVEDCVISFLISTHGHLFVTN